MLRPGKIRCRPAVDAAQATRHNHVRVGGAPPKWVRSWTPRAEADAADIGTAAASPSAMFDGSDCPGENTVTTFHCR